MLDETRRVWISGTCAHSSRRSSYSDCSRATCLAARYHVSHLSAKVDGLGRTRYSLAEIGIHESHTQSHAIMPSACGASMVLSQTTCISRDKADLTFSERKGFQRAGGRREKGYTETNSSIVRHNILLFHPSSYPYGFLYFPQIDP